MSHLSDPIEYARRENHTAELQARRERQFHYGRANRFSNISFFQDGQWYVRLEDKQTGDSKVFPAWDLAGREEWMGIQERARS